MTVTLAPLPPADAVTVASLVGIPYKGGGRDESGADCWGIVLLAARKLWALELPEYFYSAADLDLLDDAAVLIRVETAGPRWLRLELPPWPRACVHIFRIRGKETHCGLHLDGVYFLHSLPGRNSCVERLDDPMWELRRTGSYALH